MAIDVRIVPNVKGWVVGRVFRIILYSSCIFLGLVCVGYAGYGYYLATAPLPKRSGSGSLCAPDSEARQNEAKVIASHPESARREGSSLKIFYRGKLIATQTDDDRNCTSSTLNRLLPLYDPHAKTLENIAELSGQFGEFKNDFLILPSGKSFNTVGPAYAAPNGRQVIAADEGTTIYQWPSMRIEAHFTPQCVPTQWSDSMHFLAECQYDSDAARPNYTYLKVEAEFFRQPDGQWQIRGVRNLLPGVQAPLETFEPVPAPSFVADQSSAIASSPSAK